MNRELHIFNLRMLREQYEAEHVDEIVETIDVALWALQTQETLKKERDAAIAMAQPEKRTDKRTETHACDCISRQAAIHEIAEELKKDTAIDASGTIREIGEYYKGLSLANTVISRLPSAQPDYKTNHGYMWLCPECGLAVHSDYTRCVRCGWERRAI